MDFVDQDMRNSKMPVLQQGSVDASVEWTEDATSANAPATHHELQQAQVTDGTSEGFSSAVIMAILVRAPFFYCPVVLL